MVYIWRGVVAGFVFKGKVAFVPVDLTFDSQLHSLIHRRLDMALASIGATVSLLIIYQSLPIYTHENIVLQSPPMVFPLFLSQPKSTSSSRSVSVHHRKLQKSLPHSRMRLYDDLLLNG